MAEVESMGKPAQTIEAYNYANIQLEEIDADLASNAKHLAAAKKSLGVANVRIQDRLRELYINGEGDSTLEVLLGSSSLDDVIARSTPSSACRARTRKSSGRWQYRKEVEVRRSNLQEARNRPGQIVADQAAQKQSIESSIAEQNQLLARQGRDRGDACRGGAAPGRAEQARARAQAAQLAAGSSRAELRHRSRGVTFRRGALRGAGLRPEPPGAPLCARRRDRTPVPRRPTSGAVRALDRLRLLRGSACTSSRRSGSAPTPRCLAVQLRHPRSFDQIAAGDLVFFSGLGHMGIAIGGGQFVHAPHTGDVEDLQPLGALGLLRRRAPPLVVALVAPSHQVRFGVQRVDLGCEVLLHRAASDLQSRRDLAVLEGEVTRQDREALDLLEARTTAVDVVDDALQELMDAFVACERADVVSVDPARRPALDLDRIEVTSAETYGRASPTTSACETYLDVLRSFSMFCGATFLPPAVTRMSFLRSVMCRKPSSSSMPMSPVLSRARRRRGVGL